MRGRNLLVAAAAAACIAVAVTGTAFAASGLAPLRVRGAADQGPAGAGRTAITIALSPRHVSGLDALLAGQAAGRAAPISAAAFNARFAPSAATVRTVVAWARANGLHVDSVSANRELIGISGTARAIGAALGTTIDRYRSASGLTYRAPTRAAGNSRARSGPRRPPASRSRRATGHRTSGRSTTRRRRRRAPGRRLR